MRFQYCDHYLPGNFADPSLKNFRAAIVVLRWTCFCFAWRFLKGFSRVSQVLPFSVTMSRDKNHATHFFCVTMSHDKILLCASPGRNCPLERRVQNSCFILFCNACFIEAKCRRRCFHIGEYKKKCQIQLALLQ